MEKIVVSDTNIFIDLISVDLLTDFFKLPWEIHTTDMIIHELLIAEQQEAIRVFEEEGRLLVKKHSSKEMVELAGMRLEASKTSNASIQDCSVWKLAKDMGCSLLTGDGKLRKIVQKDEVEVHGILYLFDKLLEHDIIDSGTAIERMEALKNINTRLPKDEIDKRIHSWKTENK